MHDTSRYSDRAIATAAPPQDDLMPRLPAVGAAAAWPEPMTAVRLLAQRGLLPAYTHT